MNLRSEHRLKRRHGITLIYVLVAFTALVAFTSLAADYARVRLAKTELQAAVDAAARYGATGMGVSPAEARRRVAEAALQNKVDGVPLAVDPATDVVFGVWDPGLRTFQTLTGSQESTATAIRVTARRINARGNAISTPFAGLIGNRSIDVTASATATRGRLIKPVVPATACPWLAGMPNGTTIWGSANPTRAPQHSPTRVQGIALVPGTSLRFRETNGQTGDTESGETYGLDGSTTRIVRQDPVNGINATRAPLNALVGIFLDDRQPNTYSMASEPNFTSTSSRNFSTLSPRLKQVFFIGDGINSNGQLQEFVVPNGATRLYLGVMDELGFWWDNYGDIHTTLLDNDGVVTLVK